MRPLTLTASNAKREKDWTAQVESQRLALAKRFKIDVPPNLFFAHMYGYRHDLLEEWDGASHSWRSWLLFLLSVLIVAILVGLPGDKKYSVADINALCAISVLLIAVAAAYIRARQSEQKTRVIFGSIITCELLDPGSVLQQQLQIRYQFLDKLGHVQDNLNTILRRDLNEKRLPAAGTPVAIILFPRQGYDAFRLL